MSLRFFRRYRIAPGLSVNFSKSGGSLSFGPRGMKTTIGARGIRNTVGLPGAGLYYTKQYGGKSRSRKRAASQQASAPPRHPLELSRSERRRLSKGERNLLDACRELLAGKEEAALSLVERAGGLADGHYLAGFLHLKRRNWTAAEKRLERAADKERELNKFFARFGIEISMTTAITEHISTSLAPDLRGVALGLVEIYQHSEQLPQALACLERLRKTNPADVVVQLSLTELLLETASEDEATLQRIVALSGAVENETPLHAALMFYKAQALRALGLPDIALEYLTPALRRRKDYPTRLLQAIRYERALLYEELGQGARARKEWQRLFAENPEYEDVAQRLGLAGGKRK